eukprot:7379936-Prymnesium_polylepis.1
MALATLKQSGVISSTMPDIAGRYTVGAMLGEGRFSKVWAGTNVSSGAGVALKAIELATLEDGDEAVDALVKEVTSLRRAYEAEQAHVVRLHEVVETPEYLYLVLDRVEGCELFELVEQGPLAEPVAREIIAQLLAALNALHRCGVVHCDVKPENLMVNLTEGAVSTASRVTIIDFGYASLVEPSGAPDQLTGLAGSPEYAAPEVLKWLLDDAAPAYSSACDVWSVGVTAFVLLCAEPPYELPDDEGLIESAVETMKLEFRQPLWAEPAMADAREFVSACLRIKPSARPTAAQALQHRWLAQTSGAAMRAPHTRRGTLTVAVRRRVASLKRGRIGRWLGLMSPYAAPRRPPSPRAPPSARDPPSPAVREGGRAA